MCTCPTCGAPVSLVPDGDPHYEPGLSPGNPDFGHRDISPALLYQIGESLGLVAPSMMWREFARRLASEETP